MYWSSTGFPLKTCVKVVAGAQAIRRMATDEAGSKAGEKTARSLGALFDLARGCLVESTTEIGWYTTRFPVPQDNFRSSRHLVEPPCGLRNTDRYGGKPERSGDPLRGPLISGSEAIMPPEKVFVKRFVVFFYRHYMVR